ncbi:MOSC domain-containing protein [Pleomassaria siparia CBS 279.74]|uniref:MOSC domain-containing protein n=1 Tax=Pleomassaria siparia CBS 279.74 TaxID=1314801 RepID=A0A6G1JZ60_9PLEO|nr:MOSC domain-containing protein [Pleomassaria siparia CBS 279.74]
MSSNILDDLLNSVRQFLVDVGVGLNPLTIGVTLFVLLFPPLILFVLALNQKDAPFSPPPGCRKFGLVGKSNLSDQYSKRYAEGGDPCAANRWTVKALFIYPIKSCARLELDQSEVVRTGLKFDRQFTFAQQVTGLPTMEGKVESEWTFITQRTFPRLAKVETEIWIPDPKAPGYSEQEEYVKSEGCLLVRFPFTPDTEFTVEGLKSYGKILAAWMSGKPEPMMEFRVPFNPTQERIKEARYRSAEVKIWREKPVALDMANEVPVDTMEKLRYTLGITNPITLFRIDPQNYRQVHKCAPKSQDVGFQPVVGMADSYPLHILNLASVHDVASKLPKGPKRLNALRYRANVYMTGPPAFSEDDWAKARIGDGLYHISCRTTRCKLPNVDPETAVADRNEPGTTMRKHRVIDKGSKSPCLGMQVTPLTQGEIRVGDEIEVLEKGEHFFKSE